MNSYSKMIVAALDDEVKTIKSALEIDRTFHLKPATLYQGTWLGNPLSVFVTGMGPKNMREGLQKLQDFCLPTLVCHIGYAGSCSPLVGTGKIVIAETVKEKWSGEFWRPDTAQKEQAQKICKRAELSFEIGNLLTVSEAVFDPMEKAALGAEENVLALDMESSVVAQWATEKQIPFCIARAVLDPLEMNLPAFDSRSTNPQPGLGALVQLLTHHPQEALKIPQLQYCAATARKTLTEFAREWVKKT